jgi:hypothetical protein
LSISEGISEIKLLAKPSARKDLRPYSSFGISEKLFNAKLKTSNLSSSPISGGSLSNLF